MRNSHKIILIVFLILPGCKKLQVMLSDEPSQTLPIDGVWKLEVLDGKAVEESELRREHPMLDFRSNQKKLIGNTGCNQFGATFTIAENKIEIGMGAMTRMGCINDLENRFLKAFGVVNEFKIVNLSLYLMEGRNIKMIFKRED